MLICMHVQSGYGLVSSKVATLQCSSQKFFIEREAGRVVGVGIEEAKDS